MSNIVYNTIETAIQENPNNSYLISIETKISDGSIIRKYIVFSSPVEVFKYILNTTSKDRNFHEIISSKRHVKLYIDIDISPLEPNVIENVTERVIESMSKVFSKLNLTFDLNLLKLFINKNSGDQLLEIDTNPNPKNHICEYKQSIHLVYDGVKFQNLSVVKHIVEMISKTIPEKYLKYLDKGVYKSNQSFRLPYCCKLDKEDATMEPVTMWEYKGKIITVDANTPNQALFIGGFITAPSNITITNIEVPEVEKIQNHLTIPNTLRDKVIDTIKVILGEFFSSFNIIFNSVVSGVRMERKAKCACVVCDGNPIHDNIDQYAFTVASSRGITLMYGCYRGKNVISKVIKSLQQLRHVAQSSK